MASPELLTTFSRLPDYLRQRGRAFDLSPTGELLQVRYEDPEVTSVIAMRAVRTPAGTEWLALSVPLGPTAQFRPRAALVATGELQIGALADWQGLTLLRQTLPSRSLSFEQLEHVLRALAHTAANIIAGAAHRYLVR